MLNKSLICFVAGKSGGHILPCITLAQKHQTQNNSSILFFTTDAALDKTIIGQHSFITHHVALPLGMISMNRIIRYPKLGWSFIQSWWTSIQLLRHHKPEKVISSGGFVAVPVCLAAWMLHIPIELLELNAVPGKAIKFLAPLAQTIQICFAQTKNYLPEKKCELTSYPIRFNNEEKHLSPTQANTLLHLDPHKKTIIILGGSQGSEFLNTIVKQWIQQLSPMTKQSIQIIHQTGNKDIHNYRDFYHDHGISALVFTYNEQLAHCYAAADLIICRAGAGTLFEALFFNKRCLVIPLETTYTKHQCDNAQAMITSYPHLFTMMRHHEIMQNLTSFFVLIETSIMSATLQCPEHQSMLHE
jgi:UDP-N-acetylglucosamine--N-acetylmuramyl-(pentapeptide) pyrophosphoryl-undecaprenol N-acetylglucosamine transferase